MMDGYFLEIAMFVACVLAIAMGWELRRPAGIFLGLGGLIFLGFILL